MGVVHRTMQGFYIFKTKALHFFFRERGPNEKLVAFGGSINSLLKEYKRELLRYFSGQLSAPPMFPAHYFSEQAAAIAEKYVRQSKALSGAHQTGIDFPEDELENLTDNTWGDTAKAVVNNWLGLVYQVTNLERTKQFMNEVDPTDPLGLTTKKEGR